MATVQTAGSAARPVLIINPNSNDEVSALLRDAACRSLPSNVRVEVLNPTRGPLSIETDTHKAQAVPRVLDLIATCGVEKFGAIAMGCFDDLALRELRQAVPVPVIGTFEAGLLHVRSLSAAYGIVTTFDAALPGIASLLQRYGAQDCAGVRAAGVGVAAAARGDSATAAKVEWAARQLVEADGAEALLLGSGGLTGWASRLETKLGVPVVDGVESAIRIAAALAERSSGALIGERL